MSERERTLVHEVSATGAARNFVVAEMLIADEAYIFERKKMERSTNEGWKKEGEDA